MNKILFPGTRYKKPNNSIKYIDNIPYYLLNPGKKKIIIYAHGNGCDIDDCKYMFDNDKTVLLFEYPGYSCYKGRTTSKQINKDILKIANHVLKFYKPENIILHGNSIGTGPCIYLNKILNENKIYIDKLIAKSLYFNKIFDRQLHPICIYLFQGKME